VTSHEPTSGHDETGELFPLVYDELKRLARHHRFATDAPSTLCTTELVHEAFLKLKGTSDASWEGRAHFFGAASRAMRQVLVDFARRRQADKRGGDIAPITLQEASAAIEFELDEIIELDAALERLDAVDPRLRQIVELRFFAGLSENDVAEILGVSVRTVGRDWLKARIFLLRELDRA
jgi:RNA polymerase sigma factor (TIGR02999 family)